ncbi:MAG: hypothetical protein QNJ19_02085 [Woeseiaceae bacterium]|nr:hypothetical protein [Woeseiaceae bacterium]
MDPLRISLVGLSRWESVFVQTTVDLASGIDLAPWRLVNDPKSADVLLVDADRGVQGTSSGNRDLDDGPIVVSFSGEANAPGRGLTRPVSYGDLVAVLKQIEYELGEPTAKQRAIAEPAPEPQAVAPTDAPTDVPTKPTSDSTSALQAPLGRSDESLADKTRQARRFVEATRLIGLLKQVVEKGDPVEIAHDDYPSFLVLPKYSAYSTRAETLAIPGLFRCSALEFKLRPIPDDVADEAIASDRCRPLSRLLYGASLFGSEGRLLLNVGLEDRLRLNNWPDFDAVPYLPEHKTIAKFMLVHTETLGEIAAATDVRIDTIIDFCNACEATGLLERRSANGIMHTPTTLIDRMRGFFGT